MKADRLIQLVRGKITISEAPTRRDLILNLYGVDIADPKTHDHDRYYANKKLTALVRGLRNQEEKHIVDKDSLHDHNDCQFYMVQDENSKAWHCVHIIQRINGYYLLKWGRAQQKTAETMKRNVEVMQARVNMSDELRGQIRKNEIKRRWTRNLTEKYCTPKQIRLYIKELRHDRKLPSNKNEYKPNYKGIQYVFADNASEIKYIVSEYHSWLRGENVDPGRLDQRSMTYSNDEELVKNMTKDIILCDYLKQDYIRPEPQQADYLGIRK